MNYLTQRPEIRHKSLADIYLIVMLRAHPPEK